MMKILKFKTYKSFLESDNHKSCIPLDVDKMLKDSEEKKEVVAEEEEKEKKKKRLNTEKSEI